MLKKKEIVEKLKQIADDLKKRKCQAEDDAWKNEGTPAAAYSCGKEEAYGIAYKQVTDLIKEI